MSKHLWQSRHIILVLTILGAILHFYNLAWGAPFYFHPDERNIAAAVSQLSFPDQLNPHFFAYGSLPIYTIFFSGILVNFFTNLLQGNPPLQTITFEQAIIISRFYSALFATLLIPLMYLLGKRLQNKRTGIIAAALITFSTGMIQFAHFGTFELWLTLFSVCLLWHSITLTQHGRKSDLLLTTLLFGVLISIKISAVVLLVLPLFAYALFLEKHYLKTPHKNKVKIVLFTMGRFLLVTLFFCVSSALVYSLTNPYVLLDHLSFFNSIQYESSVGMGTLPVFYTSGFFDTIPVVYQFLHVYPFLLNPLLTILFIPSFFFVAWRMYKTRNVAYLLLLCLFLILFLSQAVLFIKWTRNMLPTLPFIYLIVALTLSFVIARKNDEAIPFSIRLPRLLRSLAMTLIIIVSIVFSISYFITAFAREDTRFAAVTYAKKIMPTEASILSEPYDLGITPFNSDFPNISFFNFYEYDNNAPDASEALLKSYLERSDYLILPSQRILQIRRQNAEKFPKGSEFYTNLLTGNLGYQRIYQTPCDVFCKITYLGDPIYYLEQTATVFDRPTIFIFKKL